MRIALLVCLLAGRVSAQPLAAIAQPLPDPNLAAGTVVVRVVAGEITRPVEGVPVTLAIQGAKSRAAKTDASGRVTFDSVAAASRVTVSFPSAAAELARSTFVMPDRGGIRLVMSSATWKAAGPSMRELSGTVRRDPAIAAGTLVVRLTYDNPNDPKPPSGSVVTVVAYAADGKVTVLTKPTDASGAIEFAGLDPSGRTSYFAFAQLPRAGAVDRLISDPVTFDPAAGARVVLSSHTRDSKAPPIDVAPAVAKGKVRVELAGLKDRATIELVDASTGRVLASAPGRDPETTLDLATTGVVYARTTRNGETYRSRPTIAIADRGASLAIVAMPRITPKFDAIASVEDDRLVVTMRWQIRNNSWLPTSTGVELALPAGLAGFELRDGDETFAKPTAKGFQITGPLPPGGRDVVLGGWLPIVNQRARFALDLPLGSFDSSLRLKIAPGVALVDIASTQPLGGYEVISMINLAAGKTFAFGVTAPKPDPKQIAIKQTCRELAPDRESPLIGKPAADFTAPQLDGKPFSLRSLQGKLTFVTFNASFTSLRDDQKTLPALAKQLGAELVTVLSDRDPAEVRKRFDSLQGRVVLDKPLGDENLGPITKTWNMVAVPETYVIDRKGIVRFHIVNQRDWSKPSALACLKTGI